jgi:hypothetical protein
MNRQATRNGAFATAAFHCCNRDYLSHGRPAFPLDLRTANHFRQCYRILGRHSPDGAGLAWDI